MNRRLLQFLFIVLFTGTAHAQSNNPLDWKNRKPHANYWQQDVDYTINATIDETKHQIIAAQKLRYTNNSPDTLHFVYFHLFQNAFVKDAYTRKLEKANKVKAHLGKYEAAGLGITINQLEVDGTNTKTELDNTILKVYLPKPLLPGNSTTIAMQFNTYFDMGSTRRRMKMYNSWGFMHYNGCQWFPKISVYDAKFGWDTHQHLGKEFYGDFGRFDVTLDFANNYIVEATGALQNREEVLPTELRKQLDIKNFANKPWEEAPSVITPYEKGKRKKWHFIGEHVHDFAFTADPSYRIGTTYWNNIECVAIVQEPHASGWQNAADLVATIIKTFSERYGMYHYPKMVAADARDGMEYPMLTLDGGREPGYRGLFVHEIAHNWFYGMVGSNETYRAALDEGFTQFLTADGLEQIDGKILKEEMPKSKWRKRFSEPKYARDQRALYPYVYDAAFKEDAQLNTHSDQFNSALGHGGGYRSVYYKTASMLYNLQYVLGDSLFQQSMQHYFNQWKFAHPYFDDFRNSIIQFTKVDLNWFFDQWMESTKSIDYALTKIKKVKGTDSFDITFKRNGSMQMPIDFTVVDKRNQNHSFYIPNTWFEKKTDATTLPRWIGWDKLNKTYTARLPLTDGVKKVIIDTSNRLADRMMLNNYRSRNILFSYQPIKWLPDAGVNGTVNWKQFKMYHRPDVWYNAIDGIKAGWHTEGAFLQHLITFNGTIWVNTQLGQWQLLNAPEVGSGLRRWLNYRVSFERPIWLKMPELKGNVASKYLDGLWQHQLGVNWLINAKNNFNISFQTMYRDSGSTPYLLYPDAWSSFGNKRNTKISLDYTKAYNGFNSAGYFKISAVSPIFNNSFDYNYVQFETVNKQRIHKMLLSTRIFARYGAGSSIPLESALYLAGASPEEMMDNKYTRSMGFLPQNWVGYSAYNTGNFHYGGGLGLRGYSGYYAYDLRNQNQYIAYLGKSGAAINAELDFTNYIKWKPALFKSWLKTNIYAFADAGIMQLYNTPASFSITEKISDFRADAGLGIAFTIFKWGVFDKAKPLTLRIDAPLFLNRPTYEQPQYLGSRWLLGISRAF